MSDVIRCRFARILWIAAFACGPLKDIQAGGFYVPQKGAIGVGLATAGDAARANDASTVFFNPAGMTLLGESVVQGGIDFLFPDVKIANTGSTAATPGTLGAALAYAGSNGDAGKLTPIPNFYYVRPVSSDLRFGFAVTAPFGLGLDYARDWFGRYDSIKSKLVTLDIAPSFAYRLSPSWSIGGGIDIQYADAELTNAIPDPLNPGGPSAATDGFARLTGDGWAAGFNVGAHYHPSPQTRVGLHYRSGMKHRLDGEATISGLAGPLAAANGTFSTETEFRLPPIASLGLAHQISSAWTLLAEVQWFGWSDFDEVRIRFENGAPDGVRPQRFRDTHSMAVGAEYKASDSWTLRGGVRLEKTPTVAEFRNTSIPDSDLRWFGFGASYRMSQRLAFDVGYVRASFKRADINLNLAFFGGTPVASTVNVRGRTDDKVDTLSLSLRYLF
jgi:long-chain fatty acid transport protein